MIKILCFGRFYDETPGGMQRHIEHLFAALRDEVEFVHLVPSRNLEGAEFSLNGFPVIRTPGLNVDGSLVISPQMILKAIQLQKKHAFDLIHLHYPDPMAHFASLLLPARIPRIISWHADIIRQKHLLKLYQPFLRRSLVNAAAIIVATPSHVTSSPELSRAAYQNKIHVIPYGFNLNQYTSSDPFDDVIRRKYPGKKIFTLGRHVYYKGFDVLIRAMQDVVPDSVLLIGGTGPLTDQLKQMARDLGLSHRIHFLGMIPEQELPSYYRVCDLFCLPAVSPAEAFGIVQVEAMASGTPVVSTELNNGVSVVNQDGFSGFVVPPENPDALSGALNRLLDDESLRLKLGAQARRRALQEYSLESMRQRILDVYTQIAETDPS